MRNKVSEALESGRHMSFTFTKKLSVPSFANILIVATVLRVGLIAYSEWHDAHSVVKYTDVDYRVFGDAARFTLHADPVAGNVAQGPLGRYLQLGEYVISTRKLYAILG